MGKIDFEIAQKVNLKPVIDIAEKCGLAREDLYLFGSNMGKVLPSASDKLKTRNNGKLILISAMTPTPSGEGKSTTTIGLSMALNRLGHKSVVAIREPSLGPCFGIKGGAAGGGWSQVLPMEEINLHFTGDLHATTSANNLLAAMIDNHLHHQNKLGFDPRTISWRRVIDMNDRSLRKVVVGLGGPTDGIPRETGFDVTVASEIMAVLCLAEDVSDLKERLGKIVIGYSFSGEPITAAHLKAHGAMGALLKHAIHPNIVQTIEGTPALIHGGPFANIAHGCSSVIATKLALKLSDYCVTEAGFGFDLGGEKFIDIKCRIAGLRPDCVVLVATTKALKHHAGISTEIIHQENFDAINEGCKNLFRHIENVRSFGLPVVVAVNRFENDYDSEIEEIIRLCKEKSVVAVISNVWAEGSKGGVKLAEAVIAESQKGNADFHFLYENKISLEEKIKAIAIKIYGAKEVVFMPAARKVLSQAKSQNLCHLPVCMAKTQYSFSDNPKLLNAPDNFTIEVREARICAGAGYVVALTGQIMTMPGLPANPAAENIDITEQGDITGLF